MAKQEARLQFLRDYPSLWEGLPSLDQWPFKRDRVDQLHLLHSHMVALGLYSPKTYRQDAEHGILKHVATVRRERRMRQLEDATR